MRHKTRYTQKVTITLVVLLAVVTLGLVWAMFLMPPTKNNYEAARQQAMELQSSVVTINQSNRTYIDNVVGSLYAAPDGSALKKDTKRAEDAHKELNATYESRLKSLLRSPVSRDGEVKQQLNKVEQASKELMAFMSGSSRDFPAYLQSRLACDPTDRKPLEVTKPAAREFLRETDRCSAALKKLATVRFAVFADFGKKKGQTIQAMREIYARILKEGTSPEASAKLAALRGEAQFLDPISDFEKARTKATSTTQLDNLTRLLKKKANQ